MIQKIKAFTLIEVLLGLTIFAIIGLSAYNMFWIGMRVDRKANDINRNYVELKSAFDLMSKDLENAFVYDFSSSYPKEISFSGKNDQVKFILPTKEGIRSVRYYLDLPNWPRVTKAILKQNVQDLTQDPPIQFLMRQNVSLAEYLSKKDHSEQGEIVLSSVFKGGLKFSYGVLEKSSNGQNGAEHMVFKDEWNEDTLPNVVKVEIKLYDRSNPKAGINFKREIYLPVMKILK